MVLLHHTAREAKTPLKGCLYYCEAYPPRSMSQWLHAMTAGAVSE